VLEPTGSLVVTVTAPSDSVTVIEGSTAGVSSALTFRSLIAFGSSPSPDAFIARTRKTWSLYGSRASPSEVPVTGTQVETRAVPWPTSYPTMSDVPESSGGSHDRLTCVGLAGSRTAEKAIGEPGTP